METITRNIQDLMAFYSVAKEGSFTKAAETVNSSKALLSKQVKALETQLRVSLFHRTTRSLNLTEEGRFLYSYCEKIFGLTEEAGKLIKDMSQELSGSVKISLPVSLADTFTASFLRQMNESLPNVQIEIDATNEVRDIKKSGADFAIRSKDNHDPDVVARFLGRMRDAICVAPNVVHMPANATPDILNKMNCITHAPSRNWNSWTFASPQKEYVVQAQGKFASNQYTLSRKMCLEGLGIARLPYFLVEQDIREGRLIHLFPEYKISTHSFYLVYLKETYTSQKIKTTKEAILSWFKNRKDIFI